MDKYNVGDHVKVNDCLVEVNGIIERVGKSSITVISNPWDIKILASFTYGGDGRDTFDISTGTTSIERLPDDIALKQNILNSMSLYEQYCNKFAKVHQHIKQLLNDYTISEVSNLLGVTDIFIKDILIPEETYRVSPAEIDRLLEVSTKALK